MCLKTRGAQYDLIDENCPVKAYTKRSFSVVIYVRANLRSPRIVIMTGRIYTGKRILFHF